MDDDVTDVWWWMLMEAGWITDDNHGYTRMDGDGRLWVVIDAAAFLRMMDAEGDGS